MCVYGEQVTYIDSTVPTRRRMLIFFTLRASTLSNANPSRVLQTAEVTDEIISICEEANIQLMDGTMWSHSDRAGRMQEAIAARLDPAGMGPLKAVTCTFCVAGKQRPAQQQPQLACLCCTQPGP